MLKDDLDLETELQLAYLQSQVAAFVGRKKQISTALATLKEAESVVLVHGKPGTGKSAFMVSQLVYCAIFSSVKNFYVNTFCVIFGQAP